MVGIHSASTNPATSPSYSQIFNGVIGIQPATSSFAAYDFLESMKKNNTIEHKIVSFYVNTNEVYNGVVEIGKWDYNGIHGNSDCAKNKSSCVGPYVHKTMSATSWVMTLNDILINGTEINVNNK